MRARTIPAGMARVLAAALTVALVAVAEVGQAQVRGGAALPRTAPAPRGVTVNGTAIDSLSGEPLEGAYITIAGQARAALSDRFGRFRFENLPPATYTFALQHAVLDSLGLSATTARWTIVDGTEPVQLAVPSFRTLWRSLCRSEPPARDTGFVFGTVRLSDGATPAPGTTVEAAWLDIRRDVASGAAPGADVTVKRWARTAETGDEGSYGICGIPVDVTVQLAGMREALASGVIDLSGRGVLVRRRDLVLGTRDTAKAPRGTVTGLVADSTGVPLAGVRVIIDGAEPARTDGDGRFAVTRVPAGTRRVDLSMLGRLPYSGSVDVVANEAVAFSAQLRRVNTLEVVKVVGSAEAAQRIREIEERKRGGMGYMRDSSELPVNATPAAMYAMLPNVQVTSTGSGFRNFIITLPYNRGGRCLATLFVDGQRQVDQSMLGMFNNDEIAAVELFPRPANAPPQFQGGTGGNTNTCGSLVIWTKAALYR